MDMEKIKTILTASFMLLVSVQVNAAIIDITNTNTEYASGLFADLQGLDWLTLDQTHKVSRNSIENGYGGFVDDGWRYATLLETENLLNSLWDQTWSGWSASNADGALWFLQAFGFTEQLHASFMYGYGDDCAINYLPQYDWSCQGKVGYLSPSGAESHSNNLNAWDLDGVTYNTYISEEDSGYLHEQRGIDAGLGYDNYSMRNDFEYQWAGSLLVRKDTDGDGIFDHSDQCPNNPFDWCLLSDNDGDGTPDIFDDCPSDPTNTCSQIVDSDGDGIEDYYDECPSDPTNQCNVVVYPDPDPDPNPVPEPSIIALFGLGLVGIGFARRKRQS
jgi:hypothetical protein